jgi:hypothetical protein
MKFKSRRIIGTKEVFISLIISTILTSFIIFYFGHKSILSEIQIIIGIVSLILFLFLFWGLYNGFRLKKEKIKFPTIKYNSLDSLDCADCGGCDDCAGLGDDLFGAVAAVVLWILVTIFSVIILTTVLPIIWALFVSLGLVIYWLFYRAMRHVFINAVKCRGNVLNSIIYSLFYTILYSGWLFRIISIIKFFKSL